MTSGNQPIINTISLELIIKTDQFSKNDLSRYPINLGTLDGTFPIYEQYSSKPNDG